MKNKNVGLLIIGISLVMGFIIYIFNNGMKSIVKKSCSHGPECTMYSTITTQTYISMALTVLILILGIFLLFSKPEERLIIKKIPQNNNNPNFKKLNPRILNGLNNEEKIVIKDIFNNKGSVYQSNLVKTTNFNKVKITRILDSLEGRGLIERKRRGMTNIVILK